LTLREIVNFPKLKKRFAPHAGSQALNRQRGIGILPMNLEHRLEADATSHDGVQEMYFLLVQ
jgi:hypothetical protein